jgi:hypothetical protein
MSKYWEGKSNYGCKYRVTLFQAPHCGAGVTLSLVSRLKLLFGGQLYIVHHA